jgi:uncharacterized membrane protein YbhN (UPF0104 family)
MAATAARRGMNLQRPWRPHRNAARWLVIGKVCVTAALLFLVLRTVQVDQIATRVQAMSVGLLLPPLALIMAQTFAAAARWWLVMTAAGVAIGYARTWMILLIGLFFNQSLPSTIGGDVMRIWRVHCHGCGLGKSLSVVLLDRLTALAAILLMVLVALPLLLRAAAPTGREAIVWSVGTAVVAVVAASVVFLALPGLPAALARWRPLRAVATLIVDTRGVAARPRYAIAIIALAIAVHVMSAVTVYLLARGFDIDVTLLECLMYVPAVILVTTVPVSIAGWGVREGAMVTALALSGVSSSDAVLLSIAFGFVVAVGALPGGVIWLMSGRPRPAAVSLAAPINPVGRR